MDQSIPTCPSLRNPARSRYDEFIINKRALCIEDNIEAESCAWVGTPLFCNGFSFLPGLLGILPWPGTPGGCPAGSMLLAQNNEPPVKGQIFPQQCFPGTMSSYVSAIFHLLSWRQWSEGSIFPSTCSTCMRPETFANHIILLAVL